VSERKKYIMILTLMRSIIGMETLHERTALGDEDIRCWHQDIISFSIASSPTILKAEQKPILPDMLDIRWFNLETSYRTSKGRV
jgi:hypothetical protein